MSSPPHWKAIVSLLTFLLLCIVQEVNAVHVFNVYRMLQFESTSQSLSAGSQRTSLNSLAVTVNTKLDRLSRYVVMVPAEQVTVPLVEELVNQRSADGIVVLLPNDTSKLRESWRKVEQELVHQKLAAAVYFAFWDNNVRELYEELRRDDISESGTSFIGADSYRLEVPPPDAVQIKEVNVANIQGWLAGNSKNTRADALPTIALVTYADTFGVAPGLAVGADSNGSGMVALLELARIFSRLYRNSRSHGDYNLLFLLTGAGRMNFAGTKVWLEKADSRLIQSVDFTLCLDTIGSAGSISLHVSRTDKDAKAKKLYDVFKTVADEMKIPFEVVHKKINVSNPDIPWQHEQFARKRVFAATVSNLDKAESPLSRADISDRSVDVSALKRNVKFIGEVLSRVIYNLHNASNIGVLSNEFGISEEYISSWAKTLSKYPRMMPFLTHPKDPKIKEENPLLVGLEKELSKHVADVSRKSSKLPPEAYDIVFYDKIQSEMSAFRGKPVMFDVILSLCILLYLGGLYTVLKGAQETWRQVRGIFVSSSSKKKR